MTRLPVVAFASAALLLGGAVATAGGDSSVAPDLAAKRCKEGFTHGVIARKHVCLKLGQRCRTKLESSYHRYGFHCVFGTLKRRHPACSDRRDNDADGDVDLADRGCRSARDTKEGGEPPEADLSLTSTDSPDPVIAGGDLTYTVTVTKPAPPARAMPPSASRSLRTPSPSPRSRTGTPARA